MRSLSPGRLALLWAAGAIVLSSAMASWGAAGVERMNPTVPDALLFRGWARWDAGWYAEIAQNGYWYQPGQQSPVAFFPAYPLAIAAVASLGLDVHVAGVLLTMACGTLGLWLFAKWAERVTSAHNARWAVLLLGAYPFSYYLYGAMYADALFLLFAAGAFLMVERGSPAGASLWGMVATAARPIAPGVVLGLLARQLERRRQAGERWRLVDLTPALSGLGLVAFMVYQWHRFGEPFAFVEVQSAEHWAQPPGWRTWLKLELFEALFPRVPFWAGVRMVAHALAAICALALVIPTWRRLGAGYAIYVALVVGIPAVSTKDFMGVGRYLIAAFPLFVTLALLLEHRPRLRAATVVLGACCMLLLSRAFATGAYIS